jgi:hypothetical protein
VHTLDVPRDKAANFFHVGCSAAAFGDPTPPGTARFAPYAPYLTVRLPVSTRIRLTLRLGLRTRTPSYRTPFDTRDDELFPGMEEKTS